MRIKIENVSISPELVMFRRTNKITKTYRNPTKTSLTRLTVWSWMNSIKIDTSFHLTPYITVWFTIKEK